MASAAIAPAAVTATSNAPGKEGKNLCMASGDDDDDDNTRWNYVTAEAADHSTTAAVVATRFAMALGPLACKPHRWPTESGPLGHPWGVEGIRAKE